LQDKQDEELPRGNQKAQVCCERRKVSEQEVEASKGGYFEIFSSYEHCIFFASGGWGEMPKF